MPEGSAYSCLDAVHVYKQVLRRVAQAWQYMGKEGEQHGNALKVYLALQRVACDPRPTIIPASLNGNVGAVCQEPPVRDSFKLAPDPNAAMLQPR